MSENFSRSNRPGPKDDVETWRADHADIQSYRTAEAAIRGMQVPVLMHAGHPHERVFVANFDGTGNNKFKDGAGFTNPAFYDEQIKLQYAQGKHRVGRGYVEGIGTQGGLAGTVDGGYGYSSEIRMERMYLQFMQQVEDWLKEDPNVQISVVSTGFSRGAVTASLFTQMIEQRGIQDPSGMRLVRDRHGGFDHLEFTKPPLVPPGKTAQVLAMFDPVATGEMQYKDVRPAPSVLAALQLTARHEARDLFEATDVLRRGSSQHGRYLNIEVAGAHSDVGGSYLRNGLSTLSGNAMSDFINAVSDKPFLPKRPEPAALDMYVVHHSEQHRGFYTTKERELQGARHVASPTGHAACELVPSRQASWPGHAACYDNRPVNEQLDRQYQHQHPTTQPVPGGHKVVQAAPPAAQHSPFGVTQQAAAPGSNSLFERLAAAAQQQDAQGMRAVAQVFTASPAGQDFLQAGRQHNELVRQQAQQAQLQQQQEQAAPVMRGPVMRLG